MKIVVVHDASDILEPIEQTPADIDEEVSFLQKIDGTGGTGAFASPLSDRCEIGRTDDIAQDRLSSR